MNKIKYYLFSMVLLFVATSMVFSQTKRNGTAGATELLIPVGGRSVAMGGANLTNSLGVEAMFWNPANIARSGNSADFIASHMNYIADIGVEYGAITFSAGSIGNFGFSVKALNLGNIDKTTDAHPDGTGETFSPQYVTLGVAYSKMLSDRVSVGVNMHWISEKIEFVSTTGLGFDFGVTYSNLASINGLSFALVLKNIGPDLKFNGSGLWVKALAQNQKRGEQYYKISAADFSLPTSFSIGLGYKLKFNDENQLQLVGAFTNNNFYTDQYNGGLEYNYNNFLYLRGGYTYTNHVNSADVLYNFSAGFGVRHTFGGVSVQFDYAYLPAQYFSNTNIFSITLGL